MDLITVLNPSSNLIFGFHPSLLILDESKFLIKVPSGYESLKTILPLKFTIFFILFAKFLIVIESLVPLANMFGYVNTLRSMTQGRAQFTMHFERYEAVPQAVSDEVCAKLA